MIGSVNMGRPVSQHRGGTAAAAAAAVDVLTVATAVVGLPPMDDGAVDDGGGCSAWPLVDDGGDVLQLLPVLDDSGSGCGDTDECRRPADDG